MPTNDADVRDGFRALHADIAGLRAQVDRLERQGAEVEAVRSAMATVLQRLDAIADQVQAMREERIAERAAREALSDRDEETRQAVREVARLRTEVDAIKVDIQAYREGGERPVIVHDEAPDDRPRIWESEDGRRVIWWVIIGAVLCCLALAGGLTYADLGDWRTAPGPVQSTGS